MPMAAIFVSLAVGIVVSDAFVLSATIWFGLGVATLSAAWLFKDWLRKGFVSMTFIALGGGVEALQTTPALPFGEPLELHLRIESDSRPRASGTTSTATIIGSNRGGTVALLRIYGDSTLRFKAGEQFVANCTVWPFTTRYTRYALTMQRLGYKGFTTLSQSDIRPTGYHSASLHTLATERLRRLLPDDDARSVVLAMGTGYYNDIKPEISRHYSTTAATHLLAVSGLHVGIVCLLLNLLLWPLVLVWRGNIWRSVVAIGAIWLYVALCGWSPSAIRAAIMFSVLQLSTLGTHRYGVANSLYATAALMLIVAPRLLFDVGFQLSFTAVAGIIFWFYPLSRLVKTRWSIVNLLLEAILVGLIATVATAPIVSYTFGIFSLAGVALNLPLVLISNVVVFCSTAALLLPDPVATSVADLAHLCAEWQNAIVGTIAESGIGCYEYHASGVSAALFYAVAIVVTAAASGVVVRQGSRLRKS